MSERGERPEPFCGRGKPTFTVAELLPWFIFCGTLFGIFLWWLP